MQLRAFWRAVTVDRSDFLDQFLALLRARGVRFCVIGGQAVNAYVDPVVSLDLDLVVTLSDLAQLEPALTDRFTLERFPDGLNVSLAGSDLRVQIQTDPRYEEFLAHAQLRDILGVQLPVARVEDVLRGKIWAASDPSRRGSKRQKDLADIARLLEAYPRLGPLVPDEIRRRLL
ncbi:MAG: hypothetical protein HYU37_20310 [Acidobacteria bacterium]|nr:hypothetical protein [Acidobacteriota bacterium]